MHTLAAASLDGLVCRHELLVVVASFVLAASHKVLVRVELVWVSVDATDEFLRVLEAVAGPISGGIGRAASGESLNLRGTAQLMRSMLPSEVVST